MKIEVRILDILFRRASPSQALRQLQATGIARFSQPVMPPKEQFLRFAVAGLENYSVDEQLLIYRRLQEAAVNLKARRRTQFSLDNNRWWERTEGANELQLPALSLWSVLDFSRKVLRQQEREPFCRIECVHDWREAFLLLGQDLFVCAYLAYEDIPVEFFRQDFTWPAIVHTDHPGLNDLLKKSLAENHQHLYGSSQTFGLSWCNLMNDPKSHLKIGKEFDKFYQPMLARGPEDCLLTAKERVRYACLCRCALFRCLHGEGGGSARPDADPESDPWAWLKRLQPDPRYVYYLRQVYGAQVPQPSGGTACLDYALEKHIFGANPDAPYRVLAGERYFLYSCFRTFFQGKMTEAMQIAFYLYILLKAQFRSELIQVNREVGFWNFSNYQDRKTLLCDRPCYEAELIRMAVNAPIREGYVGSLETRITPRKHAREYIRQIKGIDTLERHARRACKDNNAIPLSPIEEEPFHDTPYFYVIHFIKRADLDPDKIPKWDMPCRHQGLRQQVWAQSLALANALDISPYLCQRVRGIDSASHEIGCPPEVFAVAFRFLRGFEHREHRKAGRLEGNATYRLSATYHVGEDFLDIASALRAIDEAINFLELQRGDRIGHALGLGIEPETHYALKGSQIYMRKQERLDDLVWLLYRSRELNVHMDPHLYGKLKQEAEVLLQFIYGKAIAARNWHITLTEYYCSMQLRGDNPELYRNINLTSSGPDAADGYGEWKGCQNRAALQYPYRRFSRSANEVLDGYRKAPSLAGMYYYYHFGTAEKRRGNEVYQVNITAEYMHLVRQVQDAMQEYVRRKGITVECNPSSNVLIGTFKEYSKHPIFRLNNEFLEQDTAKQSGGGPLQVCINTDDLGVFDTSLEFEYALLFHALCELRNSDGTKKYTESDVLRYLENVRLMGNRAIFPQSKMATSYTPLKRRG